MNGWGSVGLSSLSQCRRRCGWRLARPGCWPATELVPQASGAGWLAGKPPRGSAGRWARWVTASRPRHRQALGSSSVIGIHQQLSQETRPSGSERFLHHPQLGQLSSRVCDRRYVRRPQRRAQLASTVLQTIGIEIRNYDKLQLREKVASKSPRRVTFTCYTGLGL